MLKKVMLLSFLSLVFVSGCSKNSSPSTPEIICPSQAKVGDTVEVRVISTDPDGDDILYSVDFGDGDMSQWDKGGSSGSEVVFSHVYDSAGTFLIKAQAMDTLNNISNWSEGKSIVIQSDSSYHN